MAGPCPSSAFDRNSLNGFSGTVCLGPKEQYLGKERTDSTSCTTGNVSSRDLARSIEQVGPRGATIGSFSIPAVRSRSILCHTAFQGDLKGSNPDSCALTRSRQRCPPSSRSCFRGLPRHSHRSSVGRFKPSLPSLACLRPPSCELISRSSGVISMRYHSTVKVNSMRGKG